MKLLTKVSILTLLTVLCISCSTDSYDDKADAIEISLVTPETKSIEIEILKHINEHRASIDLSPLENLQIIKTVAFSHTDYMIDTGEVSHAKFFTRSNYLKENAGASNVSENVAYGYSTARTVVNAWLKSEGHRATIEGDFTNCDISAEKNAEGRWYFTNIFIKK